MVRTGDIDLLHQKKEDVLGLMRAALDEAGLAHVDIRAMTLVVRGSGPNCPPGTNPVYEAVTLSDGTVKYHVVCR